MKKNAVFSKNEKDLLEHVVSGWLKKQGDGKRLCLTLKTDLFSRDGRPEEVFYVQAFSGRGSMDEFLCDFGSVFRDRVQITTDACEESLMEASMGTGRFRRATYAVESGEYLTFGTFVMTLNSYEAFFCMEFQTDFYAKYLAMDLWAVLLFWLGLIRAELASFKIAPPFRDLGCDLEVKEAINSALREAKRMCFESKDAEIVAWRNAHIDEDLI